MTGKVEYLNSAEMINQGDIVIYQTENGSTKIDVRFVDDCVGVVVCVGVTYPT